VDAGGLSPDRPHMQEVRGSSPRATTYLPPRNLWCRREQNCGRGGRAAPFVNVLCSVFFTRRDGMMKSKLARLAALAVLVFDLNDFKEINDHCGHAAGDLVLKEFAGRLKKAIRTSDVAARMGGDEFLAVLPEYQEGQADHLLTRIGSPEADFRGQKIPVAFAAGFASYQSGESIQSLLDRADQELYTHKRRSKGQMRSVNPEPVPARDPEANP
jgi:diguanylate cyclase (GGDEF)-like protein